jgi:AraC-like DNA-binding protein
LKHSTDLPLTIRPIVAMEDEYPAGFVDPYHAHERSQLSYSISGVMSVVTQHRSFILPPRRALWIPAGTMHEVSCRGAVRFKILYIDPTLDHRPEECRVFEVSPLLRALIDEVLTFAHAYDVDGREGRIVAMLFEEIARAPNVPVAVQMPEDRRLRRVCEAILADPADKRDIDAWASAAGMGRRTFTRAFAQQTGMGLASWRQQVRLMEAMSLIASGRPITTVSYDVGYESPSAFTAMFHRTFGVPPSHYGRG